MSEISATSSKRPLWMRLIVGRAPVLTVVRAALLGGVCWWVFTQVLLPVRCYGISMEPAYREGSINLINRWAYARREPERGDVIGIRFSGFHVMYLKRIVGLPGETIAIHNGQVLINDRPLDEPYLQAAPEPWSYPPRELGSDEFFVVGDNRSMDEDTHVFGVADRERIVGKVVF